MNIKIRTTNITGTDSITAYAEKRFGKIAKLLSKDPSAQCAVELSCTTAHHQKGSIYMAEIHIIAVGRNLFAKSEKEDMYAAIDDVQAEILGELRIGKRKYISFVRRGGARVKNMIKGVWPFRGNR